MKNPSTDVFGSSSIRAAVMICPKSELSNKPRHHHSLLRNKSHHPRQKQKKQFSTLVKATMIRLSYQGALRGSMKSTLAKATMIRLSYQGALRGSTKSTPPDPL